MLQDILVPGRGITMPLRPGLQDVERASPRRKQLAADRLIRLSD